MKRLLLLVLAGLTLAPLICVGAATGYTNTFFSSVSNPQIDAATVVNKGTITVSGTSPYQMYGMLTFINDSGTVNASPGIRFDYIPTSDYIDRFMGTFVNTNAGLISALSGVVTTSPCQVSPVGPTYIIITATNIFNTAGAAAPGAPSLVVNSDGMIQLIGTNIFLMRSGLEVLPVWGESVDNVGTYYQTAAAGSFSAQNRLNTASLWNGTSAASGFGGNPAIRLPAPTSDSYIYLDPNSLTSVSITNYTGSRTNVTGTNIFTIDVYTNIIKGAGFAMGLPGATVLIGFSPGTTPPYANINTIGALVTSTVSNSVTGLLEPVYMSISDNLASSANRGVAAVTVGCPPPTVGKPANYTFSRLGTSPGAPGNHGVPEANFFTTAGVRLSLGTSGTNISTENVTNNTVQAGDYSAASLFLDNWPSRLPAIPLAVISNAPGRVEIHASGSLDLSGTRISANLIHIDANDVKTDTNTVLNTENFSLLLSTTNIVQNIKNLIPQTVPRVQGSEAAWSAVWTNIATLLITNNFEFTNVDVTPAGSTNGVTNVVAIQATLTNTVIEIVYHVMMFDARAFLTTLPVFVHELVARGTNVVITDPMTIVQTLFVPGQSLTINGDIELLGSVPSNPITGAAGAGTPLLNFVATNAPNLQYFTNNANFSIANEAHFGDDALHPYLAFVNASNITASTIQINSAYFENGGNLASAGPLLVQGIAGKLQNGQSSSSVSQFQAGSLKLNNYRLTSSSAVYLFVTNSLLDAGPGSGSVLTAPYGFNLLLKPETGDLLGTTLQSTAPRLFSRATHTWSGDDRGLTPAGFTNNAAVGTLVLSASDAFGRHYFLGSGRKDALYVDMLDLTGLIAFQSQLQFDPTLVLYFAAAKLNSTPPPNASGVAQEAEEYLDGQFDGHLRWVQSYAGPNSSVDVLINGKTVKVNKALRFSKIIDSNGNGVPNYYDSTPFDGLVLAIAKPNPPPSSAISISFNAAPSTVYQIEFSSKLTSANWQSLFQYTNNAPNYGLVTVWVTNAPGAGFIRASYRP